MYNTGPKPRPNEPAPARRPIAPKCAGSQLRRRSNAHPNAPKWAGGQMRTRMSRRPNAPAVKKRPNEPTLKCAGGQMRRR